MIKHQEITYYNRFQCYINFDVGQVTQHVNSWHDTHVVAMHATLKTGVSW